MINLNTTDNPTRDAACHLEKAIQNFDGPTLLVISGGSTLGLLSHTHLEELEGDYSNITISILDDRCVLEGEENNFSVLKESDFFKHLVQHGAEYIDMTLLSLDKCEALAGHLEIEILQWRANYPNGRVFVMCGVGVDGHIAGIMPGRHKEAMFNERMALYYEVDPSVNEFTKRITLTAKFWREFPDEVVVYAVGEQKRDVLEKVLVHHAPYDMVPAGILHECENVYIYSDLSVIGDN